jgi:hypothetical protein
MRWIIRIAAAVLLVLLAIAFLGPLAPEGTFVRDWAEAFRRAIPSSWGYPIGVG